MEDKMEGNIFIDVEKCVACKSCEMACAVEQSKSKVLFQAIREEPLPQSLVRVEWISGELVSPQKLRSPLQCRHCEDAPCVTVCPTKALEKLGAEGPVIVHDERCIGCKWCVLVCPFGVISLRRDGKAVIKCDLCFEREAGPACVEACPTKALRFLTVAELGKERRRKALADLQQGLVAGKKQQLRW